MIYHCVLSWYENVNVLTSPIWIVMKGQNSCNSYWAMIIMNIQGLDPMTYKKLWWDIKDISKRDSSLAPSELEWGVYLHTKGR